jgi:MYXO-CTERM domain-containing protein
MQCVTWTSVERAALGWAMALGLLACGRDGAAPEPRETPPMRASAGPLAPSPEVLSWADRLAEERALAVANPAHGPRVGADGVELGATETALARVAEQGTTIWLGERELRLRVERVGRGDAPPPLPQGSPTIVGPEVQIARGPGVTEWWRSLPSGLEHGLTLADRPAGEGALVIEVALEGLTPHAAGPEGVALRDARGAGVARYDHLLVLDATGQRVASRMEPRPDGLRLVVEDAEATYPLLVDPLLARSEEARLVAADGASADAFGASVALSGDGTVALVGVPYDDTAAGEETGSARVFVRVGTGWVEQATLVASDAEAFDHLGAAVDLSADGTTALVGAPDDDPGGVPSAGSARVFVRSGSSWMEEAVLTAGTGRFGADLALSDDGQRAAVTAPFEPASLGAAYVFARSAGGWTQEAAFVSLPSSEVLLAGSVSIDATGTRIAVGSPYATANGFNEAGRVTLYARSGTTWTLERVVTAPDAALGDRFGEAVALAADGARLVVGMPFDSVPACGEGCGTARVFTRSSGTWTQQATLSPLGNTRVATVGARVAISGDVVLLGNGEYADTNGRVFLFESGAWAEAASLTTEGYFTATPVALAASGTIALMGLPAPRVPLGEPASAGEARVFRLRPADPIGTACAAGLSCLSGRCVDGVCCDTPCGGGEPTDCQACAARLTGVADGTCAPLSAAVAASVVCRAVAGTCDVAETCQPASQVCPPDEVQPATTLCRGVAGECDVPETCDGTGVTCPADGRRPREFPCRPADGACDVAEACDGASAVCPADARAPRGLTCRPTGGPCDVAEACDGTGRECPPDGFQGADVVCRESIGACDLADHCPGDRAACSADARRAAGTVCGPAGSGACDAEDVCDGASAECQRRFLAGPECRPSRGSCDSAEFCNGASEACPPDARFPAGVVCRVPAGPCDAAESCTGVTDACPVDSFLTAAVVCGVAVGPCDVEDRCTGTGPTCPNGFAVGTTCRPSAGLCDLPETCDGTGIACPTDRYRAEGSVCGAAFGVCDAPDLCTGASAECLPQYLAGVECRAARGACDVAEVCSGAAIECPPDQVLASGAVCRASMTPSCDPAEACDGFSASCPADVTTCGSDDAGSGPPDAGPAPRDAGDFDTGGGDAGPLDAGSLDAAAAQDAGPATSPATGCSCRAGARPSATTPLLGLLVLGAALARRRR